MELPTAASISVQPQVPSKSQQVVDITDMEVDDDGAGGGVTAGGIRNGGESVVHCGQSNEHTSAGSSVIVPEVGYRFEVFNENEVPPYNEIEGIEWEVTHVKGQKLIAKPVWPDAAVARFEERDFSEMFLLVCDFIKHYQ